MRFESNTVASVGGGFAVLSVATVSVWGDNITFLSNRAQFGAGIYVGKRCTAVLNGSVLIQGHRSNSGAGLYLDNSAALQIAGNVRFVRNEAIYNGAAMYCAAYNPVTIGGATLFLQNRADVLLQSASNTLTGAGGGLWSVYVTLVVLDSVVFSQNGAYVGGGMYCSAGTVLIKDNAAFLNNSATFLGGGMAGVSSAVLLLNGITVAGNAGLCRDNILLCRS